MLRDNEDRLLAVRGRTRSFRRHDYGVNKPGGIPTIREWDEFSIPIHEDIIRQVVSGKVGYSGLGSHIEIPDHSGEFHHRDIPPRRSSKPEPPIDSRSRPPEDPQRQEIQAAFRRAWVALHPDVHTMDVDTQRLERDEELKAAFAEAYKKLKAADE